MMVSIEAVDLQAAVADAVGMVSPMAAEAGVQFRGVESKCGQRRPRPGTQRDGAARGLGARRQAADAPGPRQPAQQRGQVQPHRRHRHGQLERRRRARIGPHRGQRPRHDGGEAGAPVRALQPPRRREIEHRGHRHRPGSFASSRRADGRRSPDLEHARPGHRGHPRPQGDRRALDAAAPAVAGEPARRARAEACACSMPRTTRSTSS